MSAKWPNGLREARSLASCAEAATVRRLDGRLDLACLLREPRRLIGELLADRVVIVEDSLVLYLQVIDALGLARVCESEDYEDSEQRDRNATYGEPAEPPAAAHPVGPLPEVLDLHIS
jgi:hypothetical protein